ncbi:AzlD domain-containing protein [Pollutimonas bauzanensis]|uniref:Branched-chain amino acid transport protein (AzlD) n=1 Tax=Pollutimonas bauzanensis TaxID=658167 RepID=A0A1M5ZB42_9BURK|nr:AzlD domain-containing protein [Pollutimonas bauzanensis]SHI21402.1 Branched-chain amino acid transport protein (AzlD) [Pollutimonas bauzanensis]
MTDASLLWVIALSGAGTFLIRLLPMLSQKKGLESVWSRGGLRNALDAVGPSAIVALLAASFWGMIDRHPTAQNALPIVLGLLGVMLGKRLLGSIAWATLSGVLAYGLALWALSV